MRDNSNGIRATRFLTGSALRFQPDGRLVTLVRAGYESAFEEIFRRYGSALRAYAASIVTKQRADDVTQDAFTKAYLALRHTDKEITLRPWLYRIVRNTALTNLRDERKHAIELRDEHPASGRPEELVEHREQVRRLMAGLRELPEAQRAAIVMRELEGLSHQQIAASLGLTNGAVRQSIHRARRALREGLGLLLPLPVIRLLLDQGVASGASATAAGGGVGVGLKAGVATLVAASAVTTGVALNGDLKPPGEAAVAHSRSDAGSRPGGGSAAQNGQASSVVNPPTAPSAGDQESRSGHGGTGEHSSHDHSSPVEGDRGPGGNRSGGSGGDRSGGSESAATPGHSGEANSSEGPSPQQSGPAGSEPDFSGLSTGSGGSGPGGD